jgi:two-component system phosphate regulon sensor histidine kinase PhoR
VFERVPGAQRYVVRSGRVEVDDSVGWLAPVPAADDADLVVQDRLDRAARAEFAAHDVPAAEREFATLLAQPLPATQRLAVVAAAAWQCRRVGAGAAERLAPLRTELDERIAALHPADLGREVIANAVAAALRLPRDGAPPPWAARIVPFLPAAAVAGLPEAAPFGDAQRAVLARRDLLANADREWRTHGGRERTGLAAAAEPGVLSWWLPRDDGDRDAARLPVAAWLQLVRDAGQAGEVPAWPWLVEAEISADSSLAFAGVPGVRGLHASGPAIGDRPWLLPVTTIVLLIAFGLAVWQQFRAARREADAVRAQAEFLTTVTHELKTPLASIRLLGEMLAEGRAAGREVEYYRMLTGEAGRLSMLIENVLDLGRLERGERAYDLRAGDVGEVVRETVALVAPVARLDSAEIVLRGPGDGITVLLDRGALVQALISVLDNARKYGGSPIEVDVAANGDGRVHIGVRDHGPGVPEAERERIFERFVRGEAHRHGSTPGVGIGLYLARTIARRLRGDLVCTAPADGAPGALFTFTLPMETAS